MCQVESVGEARIDRIGRDASAWVVVVEVVLVFSRRLCLCELRGWARGVVCVRGRLTTVQVLMLTWNAVNSQTVARAITAHSGQLVLVLSG